LPAAERLELFGHRPHLRTNHGARDGRDVDLAGIAVGGANRAQKALACSTPTMFFRLLPPQRNLVYSVASTHAPVFGRQVGIDHHHFGAMNNHVGDLQLAQIPTAPEHVAVLLFDLAS